ncbi:hypothetical protein [Absidia glauca]|uniref:Amino acid permease/ SLC12A domain-containing protein n=1 Tax=Absidia glauca TaxID=4829 RepID=A0A168SKI6_ABSGL|nr:hypothetical protein [Absidia glauca]
MGALSWLNKLNVFWSCAGLFLVVMILSLFATSHRDPHWVFTNYQNRTGFDNPYYVFILGMVGATYTLFGKFAGPLVTDYKAIDSSNDWYSLGAECSASMSEETENADITSPMAMVTSITTAWFFGLIYLLVLLFSIQDMESVLTTTFNLPVTQVFMARRGWNTIDDCILNPDDSVPVLLWDNVAYSVFKVDRTHPTHRSSRGGGIPYHQALQRLNTQQIPGNAVIATCIITCCIVLPYPLSDLFFEIIISAATITVYVTYAVVLGCKYFVGIGKGRFHLGPLSKPITIIGFIWSLFAVIAFTFPTCWPIDLVNANYAGPALCVVILLSYAVASSSSPTTTLH